MSVALGGIVGVVYPSDIHTWCEALNLCANGCLLIANDKNDAAQANSDEGVQMAGEQGPAPKRQENLGFVGMFPYTATLAGGEQNGGVVGRFRH